MASRESLVAAAEGATDDWAPAFRRSMIRALAILNLEKQVPAEWASIDTKWRSPMHLSRAAQADAGMKQLAAVPWLADTEIGLELLGLSEQQIQRHVGEAAGGGPSISSTRCSSGSRRSSRPSWRNRHRRRLR